MSVEAIGRTEFDERFPIKCIADTVYHRVRPYYVEGFKSGYEKGAKAIMDFIHWRGHQSDAFPNTYYRDEFFKKFLQEYEQVLLEKKEQGVSEEKPHK